MKRCLFIGLVACSLASAAHADERYFGYVDGADTLPKGETEAGVWITDRRGKQGGHYNAQDYRLELEHGFTDRLTVSTYANFESHHIRGLDPDFNNVGRNFGFKGLSAEFKYNLVDPDKNPIGLTLYAEPGWSLIHDVEGEKGTEYELELKAILQKSLFDERLVWATNFTFEPEWEKEVKLDPVSGDVEKEWEKELKLEVSTGLSYRVAPNWFVGAEARYSSVYPDWTEGLHRETYSISAGPMIAWSADEWSASLTFLPKIADGPGVRNGEDEWEKREIRLKIAHEF